MKFVDFRKAEDDETPAAYFRNAVSKQAKNAGVTDESLVQGFVCRAIERSASDSHMLEMAYNYAVKQIRLPELHLNVDEVFAAA
jgi:hypothetical protein